MWQRLTCTQPGAAALDLATVKTNLRVDDATEDATITDIAAEQQKLFLAGLTNSEVDALKRSLQTVTDSLKSMPMGSLAEDDASSDTGDAQ